MKTNFDHLDFDLRQQPVEEDPPVEPTDEGPLAGLDKMAFLAEVMKGYPGGQQTP